MNGEPVGRWTLDHGEHFFTYEDAWLGSSNARPISLSMPLRPGGEPYRTGVVQPFFDNLLPDSEEIRTRVMRRYHAHSIEPFDLLEQLGRDCVGAIQLLPEHSATPKPAEINGTFVSDGDVAEILEGVRSPSMGAQHDDEFRLSVAGAQEKTGLLKWRGRWLKPTGATPTSHLFKLPIARTDLDLSTSLENEWLCAQLLPRLGVPCASCELKTFGDSRALVIERFDRKLAPGGKWLMRLPQEDFCQVTGTPPAMKYEHDGGPGMLTIMERLLGSSNSQTDREDFFRTQVLFWLLCAIDGHAKNFSVFLDAGGSFRLTPRYDVLSAYPYFGKGRHHLSPHKVKLAMAALGKNRHYQWNEIEARHWLDTSHRCGLAAGAGRRILEEVLEQVPAAVDAVAARLPKKFPEPVSGSIFGGLLKAAKLARQQLAKTP